MDEGGEGAIGVTEFEAIVEDEQVQALFGKLGVDVSGETAKGFFQMIDFDDDGWISLEEFCSGIYRLHGTAKSIDMAQVIVSTMKIYTLLDMLNAKWDAREEGLSSKNLLSAAC